MHCVTVQYTVATIQQGIDYTHVKGLQVGQPPSLKAVWLYASFAA